MSFTYAQLKTAIQDYTDNAETTFVNHLNDFIKASEEKIFNRQGKRRNVTSKEIINPKVIIQPKSMIGLIPLKIKDKKAQIVVKTV